MDWKVFGSQTLITPFISHDTIIGILLLILKTETNEASWPNNFATGCSKYIFQITTS